MPGIAQMLEANGSAVNVSAKGLYMAFGALYVSSYI